jgi:aspartyl-tRNA(Asn)/glutamyl-tRNA(Gln) amidotransferase subunit B
MAVATYETVIGLECHVELSTRTKMFCGCLNAFGAPPNTNVCPICLGLPGSLPVPNEAAIASIVKIGLALNCEIAPHSLFHRKNYFYPDMPKDYQISQYDLPICVGGHLDIDGDGEARRIGITRVHMEEDTGKTTHVGTTGRIAQAEYALVDYNRAGVPLVEVVSEPDVRSADEARVYLTELRDLLRSLEVSDVRMEEGSLRCDANVSTRRFGDPELGTKVEIKNLNSIRSLERALRFEEERQRAALDAGEPLVQETRHWDEGRGSTHSLRSKEEAFDYRYFPEPDIPPLEPEPVWVEEIRTNLPRPPSEIRRERFEVFVHTMGIPAELARVLVDSPEFLEAFDRIFEEAFVGPRTVANWVVNHPGGPEAALRDWELIKRVLRLVHDGVISLTTGKDVLDEAVATGTPPEEIVEEKGLRQVSDTSQIEAWVDEAIAENPGPVEQYRAGKDGAINALVGQVMKRSGRSAKPDLVKDLLRQRLAGS